ncbi:MAG: hypothetical protein OHK0053_24210 [Microscillaceae bacterium]
MGFMENNGPPDALDLFITAKESTTGLVSLPLGGWSQSFSVSANGTVKITLPTNLAYTTGTGLRSTGVKITANDTVSVFAINNLVFSTDATVILPRPSLDVKPTYVIASYPQSIAGLESQYLIVGVDDATPVEVVNPNGTSFTLTLNAGQTYQQKSAGDVSGTIIRGLDDCKTFAVFAGVECVNIPNAGCTRCDHIVAQQYPTFTWDKEYLVTPFGTGRDANGQSLKQEGGYVIRLLREDNTTTATVNGSPVTWNGRFAEVLVNNFSPRCITASKPISVAQYMKGQACNGLPQFYEGNTIAKGDPAMLILNPSSQTVRSVVFNTVTTANLSDHFVNVIVRSSDLNCLTLDGQAVAASNFQPFPNCNGYSYAVLQISNGSHKLECPQGFIAYCYGVGVRESYAYTAGASFENLQFKIQVDDPYNVANISGPVESCTGVNMALSAVGEDAISWEWDFGDGSPIASGSAINHQYSAPGNYNVQLTVTLVVGCGTREVQVSRIITVLEFPQVDFGPPRAFCTGTSLALNAPTFADPVTYLWSNGATTPNITVNAPGTYSLTVSNAVGCAASGSVVVNEIPSPALSFTSLADAYCADAAPINLLSVVSPALPNASSFSVNGTSTSVFNPQSLGAGTYTVAFLFQDPATNCSSQIQKNVTVQALPSLNLSNVPAQVCVNTPPFTLAPLASPAGGTFTLNGTPISILNPQNLPVGQTYSLRYAYTDPATGCGNQAETNLQVLPLPAPVFVNLPAQFCADAENINFFTMVNPSDSQNGRFALNTSQELSTSEAQAFSMTTLNPGSTYTLSYTFRDPATHCENTVSQSFMLIPLPEVAFIDLNEIFCPNDSPVALASKVNKPGGTFTLNGTPLTTFAPADYAPGQSYALVYVYEDPATGCSQAISQTLSIPDLPVLNNIPPAFCRESSLFVFSASPEGGTFTLNGQEITDFDPSQYEVGLYTLTYTDAGNCASASAQFEVLAPVPPVSISVAETICDEFGTEVPVRLDATEGIADASQDVTYQWLDLPSQERFAQATRSGSYVVLVENTQGCTETRTFVLSTREDCTPRLYLPEAFSPNGDGLNDKLEVFGKYFTQFNLTIFNRWGEVVFQSFTPERLWDGTENGKDAQAGVYVVKLEYRLLSESFLRQETRRLVLVR